MGPLQDSDKPSKWGDTLPQRIEAVQWALGSVVTKLPIRQLAEVVSREVGRPGYVSSSTVQRWLDGVLPPDAYEITALAKLAEVTVEQMMEGLPPPAPKRQKRARKGAETVPVVLDHTQRTGGVKRPKRA